MIQMQRQVANTFQIFNFDKEQNICDESHADEGKQKTLASINLSTWSSLVISKISDRK